MTDARLTELEIELDSDNQAASTELADEARRARAREQKLEEALYLWVSVILSCVAILVTLINALCNTNPS